jgi:beta-glucanase (GH16 family)
MGLKKFWMKTKIIIFALLGIFALSTCHRNEPPGNIATNPTIPTTGYSTPDHYNGMTLVWQDEFNGDVLDTTNWNYETGGNGWGNNELEYYQSNNTTVKGGYLIIQAKQEDVDGRNYTSSRLTTQGKKSFEYGRADIRAVLPKGKGLWPALWMLGNSISTVGWPTCGEVDIMEMVGGTSGGDNTVHGTSHWNNNGDQSDTGQASLSDNKIFADDFHVFSVVWTATSITYYLDDIPYHTTDTTPDSLSAFRASFFFIFNVAVGGDWPGSPDATTVFPQQMVVDYIRVFQ